MPSISIVLRRLVCAWGILGGASFVLAAAAAPAADKSVYSWSNPTPVALLRDFVTDRPNATESPFTVDAGHVQLEMDFANRVQHRVDGTDNVAVEVAPFNVRFGLSQNTEVGIFVSPYLRVAETPPGGPRAANSGPGDLTLRAKYNFWGNDGGESAGGLILDVALPTAAKGLGRDRVEGSVAVPFAFGLGGGWDGGAMTVLEFRHQDSGGYRPVWTNTATVGHELSKDISGYVELTSSVGDGSHVATFDVGVMWKLSANLQVDCGANLGITREADDLLIFAGIARRF